jgi:hypothetical protein
VCNSGSQKSSHDAAAEVGQRVVGVIDTDTSNKLKKRQLKWLKMMNFNEILAIKFLLFLTKLLC